MEETLNQLVMSLRKTISEAQSSTLIDDRAARTLHRALALLWSAHDELEALQALSQRHAA